MRLGARVVKVEPPEGDPMQHGAPAWYDAVNAGKEIVDVGPCVGLPGRPGALRRAPTSSSTASGPGSSSGWGSEFPRRAVVCAITGFGDEGRHARRAGHDLNYMGWAGALADTAPGIPPVQAADLAAGALGAIVDILAALLERGRTGRGRRITISMTHGAHRLVAHRRGGDVVVPRLLTGGAPCYAIYPTADGRFLTVAALEPKFWQRLCQLLERDDLVARQYEPAAGEDLAAVIATRSLAEWLELFDGEDVCVGPVWTVDEAAAEFGS